jgi:hypothetical protein
VNIKKQILTRPKKQDFLGPTHIAPSAVVFDRPSIESDGHGVVFSLTSDSRGVCSLAGVVACVFVGATSIEATLLFLLLDGAHFIIRPLLR